MKRQKERRRWVRKRPGGSGVALLYPEYGKEWQEADAETNPDYLIVHVTDSSGGGFLLESPLLLEAGSSFDMRMKLPEEELWSIFRGRVIWTDSNPDKENCYLLGVELQPEAIHDEIPARATEAKRKGMWPSELEFLLGTQLLDVAPQEAKCALLNCMRPRRVAAGERLISQGDEGDYFYIIQDGTCIVNIEKDGIDHPINRLKAGEIVGEMALLTGERRSAHVDAETDMTLWCLSRGDFDKLCTEHADLMDYLTELVTDRLSTEKLTAHRTVGKYIINDILGRGGWSIVYRGTHASLNMPVAIKMLKHTMAMNPDFFEKFRNEAKTIAHLNHENIVKVYDIEELYKTIFIVMEYLDGVSLAYILEKMPKPPLPKIVDILLQVCAGLAYAHENGIVHQDVKPANIFIQADDRTKIVDFGLSCPPGSADCGLPGTVYYMSPEQIEGEAVDERTDIYSLGIVAYEMVTGQRPYPEDDIAELMYLHVEEDVPDPRELVPDLPDELSYLIKRATQRDPSGRFRTVWEIIRDLQPFADKLGVERKAVAREPRKMMSLFLFYEDEHQLTLKRVVEEFSKEVKKVGAELRAADFKDV
jgi:predicted Ser/Thr protein kinase